MAKLAVSDTWKVLAQTSSWTDIFKTTVNRYGNNEALVFIRGKERQSYSYKQYAEKVLELAKGLYALGVRKGTHVGLWMTNRPEWCFARLAIYQLGAVMIPLNTRYKVEEMQYVLRQSDTEFLLMEDAFVTPGDATDILRKLGIIPGRSNASIEFPALRRIISLGKDLPPGIMPYADLLAEGRDVTDSYVDTNSSPQDTLHIIYTSGTTGFPKGVETPYSCNVAYCAISAELYDLKTESRYLNLMPFFGNIGLWNHTLPIIRGATLVTGGARFQPEETMQLIQQERVTHVIFVPTMLQDILNHPRFSAYDLSSLQRITCAGAPVARNLILQCKEKLGLDLMNIYGLSEASGLSTWVPYGDTPKHVEETVGLPMPHCEVAIMDPKSGKILPAGVEGEICTKETFSGSQHMKGYYKQPELTAQTIVNGWLHSGDLGMLDNDGYLYIRGRLKEMLTVGGFNVSPAEVENYLLKHPKVSAAAVVGAPDNRLGEVVAAFIKLKPGMICSEAEIVSFCREGIANIKVPRYVFFVEEFPLTPQGKVQKFKLREQVEARIQNINPGRIS